MGLQIQLDFAAMQRDDPKLLTLKDFVMSSNQAPESPSDVLSLLQAFAEFQQGTQPLLPSRRYGSQAPADFIFSKIFLYFSYICVLYSLPLPSLNSSLQFEYASFCLWSWHLLLTLFGDFLRQANKSTPANHDS